MVHGLMLKAGVTYIIIFIYLFGRRGSHIWNFMVFFMVQMLLCVGSFFGTSEESEKEWEAYKTGSSAGGMFILNKLGP